MKRAEDLRSALDGAAGSDSSAGAGSGGGSTASAKKGLHYHLF